MGNARNHLLLLERLTGGMRRAQTDVWFRPEKEYVDESLTYTDRGFSDLHRRHGGDTRESRPDFVLRSDRIDPRHPLPSVECLAKVQGLA